MVVVVLTTTQRRGSVVGGLHCIYEEFLPKKSNRIKIYKNVFFEAHTEKKRERMHHRRWCVALVLFLFLSGAVANSSRIAETRQREEKKEDEKKLAFSYDTNDNKRVALGARFLEDDQLDSQEECMRDAFFSIFNQHHHHGGGRRFKGSEEDIFCEHLVQAKDKDALKCLVAVNAVSCRLERSKVKSRLGKCNKKRFDGGC